MSLPELPPRIYDALKKANLEPFWDWFQVNFKSFVNNNLHTSGDVTVKTAGNGLVVSTPDGTKQYRVGVDNAGNPTATLIP